MLVLESVSYRYENAEVDALREFSLTARKGEITALLGANGSGKSTALGIAASWLKPASGRYERNGMIAYLSQSERLAFSFTCLEYVCFGRAPHLSYFSLPSRADRKLAEDALRRVNMIEHADRRITAISGGELQLVRIARALVQEADWLLLDEPGDMLDPAHIATVGSLLRELSGEGRGILFSTHDIAFALAHADRAGLIKKGRMEAFGDTAEILTTERLSALYGHPFVLASVPVPYTGT